MEDILQRPMLYLVPNNGKSTSYPILGMIIEIFNDNRNNGNIRNVSTEGDKLSQDFFLPQQVSRN